MVMKVQTFDADSGQRTEQSALDMLMMLLHIGYDIGQASEFGGSSPELLVTVPVTVFERLHDAAKHSQFKACRDGENPNSGLPFFEYDYRLSDSRFNPAFRLIVQQGCESGKIEIKN